MQSSMRICRKSERLVERSSGQRRRGRDPVCCRNSCNISNNWMDRREKEKDWSYVNDLSVDVDRQIVSGL